MEINNKNNTTNSKSTTPNKLPNKEITKENSSNNKSVKVMTKLNSSNKVKLSEDQSKSKNKETGAETIIPKGTFAEKRKEMKEKKKQSRIDKQVEEIEQIRKRLDQETPPCGHYPKYTDEINETTPINLKPKIQFKELAISQKTLKGLNDDKKFKLTPIQRAAIPHALYNRDILGASKTGSGKTIAFVIPVLEKLFLNRWSSLDGLGALIILPTRELAIQVFEVVRTLGKYHDFSLGLVIGGNNLEKEQNVLYNMNILVATPGRILQHISETPYFNLENLQILIIDEADRILDEGFADDLTEILKYLPDSKQTLMFSATLTKDIKSLAKLNLRCPEHISINNIENLAMMNNEEHLKSDKLSKINLNLKSGTGKPTETTEELNSETVKVQSSDLMTPKNLQQFYTIVEADKKIDTLYSFLNTHKNSKIIVFLSSCKQVRFYYEAFKRMKLGFHFLELHGGQKQNKRTAIFYCFVEKNNTVLFATDIAARGIDFPSVNWVVQVDAPEDVQTYIHRVGRTARYKSSGSSLLFLSESEKEYLSIFEKKNLPVKHIKINRDKVVNMQPILRSILSENPDILYLAQRAIISYIKSIAYQPNKKIFDFNSLDVGKLSLSYGLMSKPKVMIKAKDSTQDNNKISKENDKENNSESEDDNKEEKPKLSKIEKFKEKIKKKKEEKKKQQDKIENINDKEVKNNKLELDTPNQNKVTDKSNDKDNDFLKIKRKFSMESDSKITKEEFKPKDLTEKKIVYDKSLVTDRFKGIENELKLIEKESKAQEKERVKELHKVKRAKSKAKDYEKHGLDLDNGENDENDEDGDDNQGEVDDVEDAKDFKDSNNKKYSKNTKNDDDNEESDEDFEIPQVSKHNKVNKNDENKNKDKMSKEQIAKSILVNNKSKKLLF